MILINGRKLQKKVFPNGEQKISEPTIEIKEVVDILLKWESDQDLIDLLFVKGYLDTIKGVLSRLEILYMPYSRMDRKIEGDLFTLKTICSFLNALGFDEVLIHEPHSNVTPDLLNNCTVNDLTLDLFDYFKREICEPDYVLYPDAGAVERYPVDCDVLIGSKIRDVFTGRIEDYNINISDKDIVGKSIVILDDLSSYGGTFMKAADILKKAWAGDIYLIVAHCEKSILDGKIFSSGLFKKVLTTNSIIDITHSTEELIIKELYHEEWR